MDNNSFEIGEVKYKLRKIDAFKQFHIVRKVAPILSEMLPVMKEVKALSSKDIPEDEKWDQMAKLATPIVKGLSKLSDEDADKVLMGLLSAVETYRNGAWSMVVSNNQLMFQDLTLPMMLNIAGRAFMFNISSFFTELPRHS